MTESQWNTYIQINIYGPTLQELCNRGVFLSSILQEIGCPNHWISEEPLEVKEQYSENLITDWDPELVIEQEEVLDSVGQPVVSDSENSETPEKLILSTSASEFPRNSTPMEDDENLDSMMNVTASTIHSEDEEQTIFLIEDAPKKILNPNDSLFKSGPLLFFAPECSLRPETSSEQSNAPENASSSEDSVEEEEKVNDDDEVGLIEDEYGNWIEIELVPNTSQNFFHYNDGNFTPHYAKGCKNREHWPDGYENQKT